MSDAKDQLGFRLESTEIKTYVVRAYHDLCMRPHAELVATGDNAYDPHGGVRWVHRCQACGALVRLSMSYPAMQYRMAGADSFTNTPIG